MPASGEKKVDVGRAQHTKTVVVVPVVRVVVVAVVRARVVLIVVPGAAAQHARLVPSKRGFTWIRVLVPAPLPNIAMHIVQAKGIGRNELGALLSGWL